MSEVGISKELSAFNEQILTLNLLNINLESLFTKNYDIRSELSIIDSFLNHYFYLASSRIILILSSIYDNHDKDKDKQLTFSYFISDKENPLYKKFEKLKGNHRLQNINKHRHNLIAHINLDANIDKSRFLSRYKLFNNDIYNFTVDTVDLAKDLNRQLNNPWQDFTIINPTFEDLKLLAEEYNLLDKLDIISLRNMKRNNSVLFNTIKEQISDLIRTSGY